MLNIIQTYMHGYVAVPLALACRRRRMFAMIDAAAPQSLSLTDISRQMTANPGHLAAALQVFQSLGWLEVDAEERYSTGPRAAVIERIPEELGELSLPQIEKCVCSKRSFQALKRLLLQSIENWGGLDEEWCRFLDGCLVVPIVVAGCGDSGPVTLHSFLKLCATQERRHAFLRWFSAKGWVDRSGPEPGFSELGKFIFERRLIMASVHSYRPMIAQVDTLLFGDAASVFATDLEERERHVERGLNVIASGFQHERYFQDVDQVLGDLFDHDNFDDQPRYVADMGCGDGTLLKRIYRTVAEKTRRGKHLASHPLVLIGVDFNAAARDECRKTLEGLPHLLLAGDIGDPKALVNDLKGLGVDPEQVLHIRSFLDHDRRLRETEVPVGSRPLIAATTSVHVNRDGSRIPPELSLQDLVAHLGRWADVTNRHGLLLFEVHCLSPLSKKAHLEEVEALHFDAYHSLSGQMLVEADVFLLAAAQVGLIPNFEHCRRYPKLLDFTRLTFHHFIRQDFIIRQVPLQDAAALAELRPPLLLPKTNAAAAAGRSHQGCPAPIEHFVLERGGRIAGAFALLRVGGNQVTPLRNADEATAALSAGEYWCVALQEGPATHRSEQEVLLHFALHLASLRTGPREVLVAADCPEHRKAAKQPLANYLANECLDGFRGAPGLRFYAELGGEICGILEPGTDVIENAPHDWAIFRFEVKALLARERKKAAAEDAPRAESHAGASVRARIKQFLLQTVNRLLEAPEDSSIDAETALADLGLDSMDLLELRGVLAAFTKLELTTTFFFSFPTIEKIADALAAAAPGLLPSTVAEVASPTPKTAGWSASNSPEPELAPGALIRPEDVAIIGVACRFPGDVATPEGFWRLLVEKKDPIGPMPEGRATRDEFLNAAAIGGRQSILTGGFLGGIENFDNDLFNLTPRECEWMDPQQRIVLEMVWEALESAGLDSDGLRGSDTSVFAAAFTSDYERLQGRGVEQQSSAYYGSGNCISMLAGRVSYLYGFHGPAMSVNTACSSSLVALHYACRSLLDGESNLALACGTNLILQPDYSVSFASAGMLSAGGRCKAFDASADGFVRSEGAGVLLLKRAQEAVRDGDNIWAVIKASAINQDGASNGLTAPNGKAQESLLREALRRAKLAPSDLAFLESHGTGTPLGDPIEWAAINAVYGGRDTPLVIGAVKSNIGHCEAAAGMAGLVKAVLSLQHRQVPPNLHFTQSNPQIALATTPAVIPTEVHPLNSRPGTPLRAGVSAFGFSGTNAHVIVEEFRNAASSVPAPAGSRHLMVFSAKSPERLRALLDRYRTLLESDVDGIAHHARDLAYTLQTGRRAMEERVCFLVSSSQELLDGLRAHLDGGSGGPALYRGNSERDMVRIQLFEEEINAQEVVSRWISKGDWAKVARYWVSGGKVEWSALYTGERPRRLVLPTYPFAPKPFWVERTGPGRAGQDGDEAHPLLQRNISTLREQAYESCLSPKMFFFRDHAVNGECLFPAVCYLEMARAAVERELPVRDRVEMRNIVWSRPVIAGLQANRLTLALRPGESGSIQWEVFLREADGEVVSERVRAVCSKGEVMPDCVLPGATESLAVIRERCPMYLEGGEFYGMCRGSGFAYGNTFQSVKGIWSGKDETLAEIRLPLALEHESALWQWHPGLMDGALQPIIALRQRASKGPGYPFALERLKLKGALPKHFFSHIVRRSLPGAAVEKYDVFLRTESGELIGLLTGLSVASASASASPAVHDHVVRMYRPDWNETAVAHDAKPASINSRVVVLCGFAAVTAQAIEASLGSETVRVAHIPDDNGEIGSYFERSAAVLLGEIQRAMRAGSRGDVLVQVAVAGSPDRAILLQGLTGLLRTTMLEAPRLRCQFIGGLESDGNISAREILDQNAKAPQDFAVGSEGGKRTVFGWRELNGSSGKPADSWKDGGVYLITGGAGGLGMIFARDIVRAVRGAVVILVGRSKLSDDRRRMIEDLSQNGCRVSYRQVDLSSRGEVSRLVSEILDLYHALDGVIHAAGVTRDKLILAKTNQHLSEVFSAKVHGLVNLDFATRALPLDFFVTFSSLSGALGNVGQADYAAANAFMDRFAAHRNRLVAEKTRKGRTVSINWPLWREGGMRVPSAIEKSLFEATGIVAMESQLGVKAFHQCLSSGCDQVVVAHGDGDRLDRWILSRPAREDRRAPLETPKKSVPRKLLQSRAETFLKEILSSASGTPATSIDADLPLEQYGVDSIMVLKMTEDLEAVFGPLSKTLLFEYKTLRELGEHFLTSHEAKMIEKFDPSDRAPSHPPLGAVPERPVGRQAGPSEARIEGSSRARFVRPAKEKKRRDIAIVGVAGRYPCAENLEEFWDNLKNGRDCVTEVPADRWASRASSVGNKRARPGVERDRGGFVDHVDKFDSLFFNIAPSEAELLDPQQRLFLEAAWATLEDAGYTRSAFGANNGRSLSRKVGVFVGVMYREYAFLGMQGGGEGPARRIPWTDPSSIANRVSYFCDFHGPSMAVDTMCSSSLSCIHLACESIRNESCEAALAGGVNLSIHPYKYEHLEQLGFLSPSGLCASFGAGGEGYIPGEAVGCVLLKPLEKAEADGDHIYGIIRGTALNHGGKSNGYTVPNPRAQADLITQALADADLDPRMISYVEAHGTGTALGDPIEFNALQQAYGKGSRDGNRCALGSVKSNIGHCEAAAGIAGLTKTLLQMKHRMLVPSLHSDSLNPDIAFEESQFVIQGRLSDWRRPRSAGQEWPRIAAVSAFGAGGSNAHLIVEEYPEPEMRSTSTARAGDGASIIVLSAMDENQLREYARRLQRHVARKESALENIAYTLQIGRETLKSRLALVVSDLDDLERKLDEWLRRDHPVDGVYHGTGTREIRSLPMSGPAGNKVDHERILKWIAGREMERLADHWVREGTVDWNQLYGGDRPLKVSLPSYPFARHRHWLSDGVDSATAGQKNGDHNGETFAPDVPEKPSEAKRAKVLAWLKTSLAGQLKLSEHLLAEHSPLQDFGVDSILLLQWIQRLEGSMAFDLNPSVILEFPTLAQLSDYFVENHYDALMNGVLKQEVAKVSAPTGSPQVREPVGNALRGVSAPAGASRNGSSSTSKTGRVAIVGMACHFPGAANLDEFWRTLKQGKDCIREVPTNRWELEKFFSPAGHKENKSISRWGGFLEDIQSFDPRYFGMEESLAVHLDPLARQWLEVSAEALADAGYGKKNLWGENVGVFAGSRVSNFLSKIEHFNRNSVLGLGQNLITALLSHFYNFKGPNMVVDTACSSSLTSIHLAINSLLSGESTTALAGGVDILLDEYVYLVMSAAQVLSPTGRCKTMDASADGMVLGEGCGVVVLKTLTQAILDKNKIYGVIEGTAINSDGNSMGITTPDLRGQQAVIERAVNVANIPRSSVSYVEMHGTGTVLGDAVELRALSRAFEKDTPGVGRCGVGSVKSNLGHLLSAGGIAGLIKILLSMVHHRLPPTLHCARPNPRFNFENSPFYPVLELKPWEPPNRVLRAGLSSFGLGGNNAHLVVSNEGIPDNLMADTRPLGPPVKFERRKLWPSAGSESLKTSGNAVHDDEAFLEMFDSSITP